MSSKVSLKRYFILIILQTLAANFAHPVTPTLISDLKFHSYMFGVAFASMSLTYFLFAPFWGKVSDLIGRVKVLALCCVGYAVGQWVMSGMHTEFDFVIARLISGFFIGGISVCQLTYIIDVCDLENRGRNLVINATIQSVCGPLGYLIGGLIGTYSIPLLFGSQVLLLALSGILFFIFLKDVDNEKKKVTGKEFIKNANPFASFIGIHKYLTKQLVIFFVAIIIASFGITAFDQCFNYYIKDVYGFLPAYNGLLKAVIGIIALLANVTICMWLMKNTTIKKTLVYVYALTSIVAFFVAGTKELFIFVVVAIIYFALVAIVTPLQQQIVSLQTTPKSNGQIMGFYSSVNSLGMVCGSLFAGFIYDLGPSISFLITAVCFLCIAVLIGLTNRLSMKG